MLADVGGGTSVVVQVSCTLLGHNAGHGHVSQGDSQGRV